jgi:hypothetical protein
LVWLGENKETGMRFSYSAVWDDTVAMLRAHASLLVAVAGVFLFLPALFIGQFLPQPQADPNQMGAAMIAYFSKNWDWFLLSNLVNMAGAITMFQLLLSPRGETVGAAIRRSLPILPIYFAATLLVALLIGLAVILILVPLVLLLGPSAATSEAAAIVPILLMLPVAYLFGRVVPLGPVVVMEERYNPIRALRRTFYLTRSRGWAVLGLVLLVFLAGGVVDFAISRVFGALFLYIAGTGLGGLLTVILSSLFGAILSTIIIVLFAAIYRRLLAGETPNRGT